MAATEVIKEQREVGVYRRFTFAEGAVDRSRVYVTLPVIRGVSTTNFMEESSVCRLREIHAAFRANPRTAHLNYSIARVVDLGGVEPASEEERRAQVDRVEVLACFMPYETRSCNEHIMVHPRLSRDTACTRYGLPWPTRPAAQSEPAFEALLMDELIAPVPHFSDIRYGITGRGLLEGVRLGLEVEWRQW